MKERYVEAMVERLVRGGAVAAAARDKALSLLKEFWQERVALVISEQDVIRACPALEPDEARVVLGSVLFEFDLEKGVNLDTVVGAAIQLYGHALDDPEDELEDEDDDDG